MRAIAVSHPHCHATMQDWAAAFWAPVYLHEAERAWIMHPSPSIRLWEGDTLEIVPGATLIRAGGHFAGGTVLHWSGAADGQGVLLAGDIVQVTPGARRVTFMWSYPNMMPLPAGEVRRVVERRAPWSYERIYGAFLGQELLRDGPGVVARSAERYVALVGGTQYGAIGWACPKADGLIAARGLPRRGIVRGCKT
ncbi:MAG TPA: hypothetical protein VHL31_11470 [Geminicoccus sp.]|uniref:hypothetical protein n=1 Tax=Geminicoccus sp. TaxID=2024832 RepID=UPI002E331CD3|nr:hypothetical protein [Geminicoccus sp.]HEX2526898.1 hypothetical protein [Geminicoccus sp.]